MIYINVYKCILSNCIQIHVYVQTVGLVSNFEKFFFEVKRSKSIYSVGKWSQVDGDN